MTYEHSDNYLVHYGVKGQKHGIRRFQNEDGSLTAEGREHYGVGEEQSSGNRSSESQKDAKKSKLSPEEKKQRTKKILKIAAGVAVAAIVAHQAHGYAKYVKSGQRDRDHATIREHRSEARNLKDQWKRQRLNERIEINNQLERARKTYQESQRPSSSRVASANDRARRNLDEINRRSREQAARVRRVDDQLERMNRKYGLR